jgi:hypothetical protein
MKASTKSIQGVTFLPPGDPYRGRIYRYITFYAAALDILTEGFHTKSGKVESLISCMIIAANKSSKEVIDDESKRAFYEELSNTVRS